MTATNPRHVTLFHAAQSRSGGVLALLEEIGADYELSVLDLRHGEQRKDGISPSTRWARCRRSSTTARS